MSPQEFALVFARRMFISLIMVTMALGLTGAVRKVATITSEPCGAKVWINGVYRGKTPVEIPYNWNWYYDIRLEKDGYDTLQSRERFHAPVKHWIPFDFVAEVLPVRSPEPQWRHYQMQLKKKL